MIFIVVKFPVRPEHVDDWLTIIEPLTAAVRDEPGNLFYEWSRSVDDPNQFVLLEGFRDADAGAAHVQSEHFLTGIAQLASYVERTPQIVNVEIPGTEWSTLVEMTVPEAD